MAEKDSMTLENCLNRGDVEGGEIDTSYLPKAD
jgi:hypothetical protein